VNIALVAKPVLHEGLLPLALRQVPDLEKDLECAVLGLSIQNLEGEDLYIVTPMPETHVNKSIQCQVLVHLKQEFSGLRPPWVTPAGHQCAVLFCAPRSGKSQITNAHLDSAGGCNALLGLNDTQCYALWAFFPLWMWGDSTHKSVLIKVLGSADLVGSTNATYALGTLEKAVEEDAPWLAMKELLQIPHVVILKQRPGDVVCFGTGWGHMLITVGRSIKVGCDLVESHDIAVMGQSRQVLARMKKGGDQRQGANQGIWSLESGRSPTFD
jgi:hypothetical protein